MSHLSPSALLHLEPLEVLGLDVIQDDADASVEIEGVVIPRGILIT